MALSRNSLIVLAIIGLIAVMILVNSNTSNRPLAISEVSCLNPYGPNNQYSANIRVSYTLATDTQRLASLIPSCQSNPTAGFVGAISFDAIEPDGTIYNLGQYSATPENTQKISCGTNQGGKEFAGGTIPNQGLGSYMVRASGVYYLPNDNYTTPHSFQWTQTATVSCFLPSSTCSDGTLIGQCSTTYVGQTCTDSAELYPRASVCGCPSGQVRSGNNCVIADPPSNVVLPTGQPLPPGPTNQTTTPPIQNTTTVTPPTQIPTSTIPTQYIFGLKTSDIAISITIFVLLIAYYIYNKK